MIDEALKLVGGAQPAPVQEPVSVGWQRRLKFPAVPGAVPLWQQCSAQEAMLMFERSPLHEYREVFTAPPAQPADHFAGGGKPIQAAHQCHWRQSDDDSPDTWEGTCGSTKENE
jgi:hypothetical protein